MPKASRSRTRRKKKPKKEKAAPATAGGFAKGVSDSDGAKKKGK
jgi:hypothetical protein